jgi:serine/threonine protein kinase
MFKEEGNLNSLRIVDFGLSTFDYLEKFPFPKCGTPGYVAPEVANLK